MRRARHMRFTDGAGFTRHCWECVHAKDWEERSVTGYWGTCELTGRYVGKYDSPNNQCSHLPAECDYDSPNNQCSHLPAECDYDDGR